MPPSRKTFIGPIRTQWSPTPVGPFGSPRIVTGQLVEPGDDRGPIAERRAEDARGVDPDGQLAAVAEGAIERKASTLAPRSPMLVIPRRCSSQNSSLSRRASGCAVVAIGVGGQVLEHRVGVAKHAGRLAGARVLDDLAGGRVGRVAGDSGVSQGLRVDHPGRPALVQDHVLGRDPVKLGPGGEPALGQPGRKGIADDDPGTLGLGLHPIADVGHHVGERLEAGIGWSASLLAAPSGWTWLS